MEQAILIIFKRDYGCLVRKTDDLSGGLFPRLDYVAGDSQETVEERVLMETGLEVDVDMSRVDEVSFLIETPQRALPHLFALYTGPKQGVIDQEKHCWMDFRKLPVWYERYAPYKLAWEQDVYAKSSGQRALEDVLRKGRKKWNYSQAASEDVDAIAQLCSDVGEAAHGALGPVKRRLSIEDEDVEDYLYYGYQLYTSNGVQSEYLESIIADIDDRLTTSHLTDELIDELNVTICMLAARSRDFLLDGDKGRFYSDIDKARHYLAYVTSEADKPLKTKRASKGGKAKASRAKAVSDEMDKVRGVIQSVVKENPGTRKRESNTAASVRMMPIILEKLKQHGLAADESTIRDELTNILAQRK